MVEAEKNIQAPNCPPVFCLYACQAFDYIMCDSKIVINFLKLHEPVKFQAL